MTTCLDFERDIERERRGELDPAAQQALAAHLSSCAACCAYERGVDATRALLGALLPGPTSARATAIQRRLLRRAAVARRETGWAIAGGVVALFGWAWFMVAGVPRYPALVHGALASAVGALVLVVARGRRRALEVEQAEREGDYLSAWRQDLDRRTRQISVLAPLLCGGASALLALVTAVAGVASGAAALYFAMLLSVIGVAGYQYFVELPRLRRERAALEA